VEGLEIRKRPTRQGKTQSREEENSMVGTNIKVNGEGEEGLTNVKRGQRGNALIDTRLVTDINFREYRMRGGSEFLLKIARLIIGLHTGPVS